MSEQIIIGESIWQLPDSQSYSLETSSWTTVKNYQGTKEEIDSFAEQLISQGVADNLRKQGGVTHTLSYTEINTSTTQTVDDSGALANASWECQPEQIDTDIKQCPDFRLLKDKFAIIDKATDNGNMDDNGNFDIAGYCAAQTPVITIEQYWDAKFPNTKAGKYYMMKVHGVASNPLYRWVIRKTITINRGSMINVSSEGIGLKPTVCTTAEIGIPNDVNLNLPSGYLWLVIPPSISRQSRTKKQIVYEWRGAERYSPTLYTGGNKEVWEP